MRIRLMAAVDVRRILYFVVLGAMLGWVFQNFSLGLLLASIGYIIWLQRNVHGLLNWIRDRKRYDAPNVRGVIEDISLEVDYLRERHKKRKKKLGNYLKQFRQATRALPDATVVLDDSGNVRWANKAAEKLLGVGWPEDVSQRITNLIRTPELVPFVEDKKPNSSIDIVAPFNEETQLNVRLAPYGKDQWLFVARDISDLNRAHDIRKDFVANVSHELRTPITVIRGYLETLVAREDQCPPDWVPALEQMTTHTDRMQSLVEDLLLLSRLEQHAEVEAPEPVSLAELTADIQQQMHSMSDAKDRIFSLELDSTLRIFGSRRELYSAISNLVLNAIRYTDARDVIEIKWYQDDDGAHLSVRDHGIGIAEEHIPRLTERFYRVDSSRARTEGGTGLGLAIVKHVLSRHQASLVIESDLGKGSLFRCDFPNSMVVPEGEELLENETA